MFRYSILNMSIWILSGFLFLVLLVLIFLRAFKIDIFKKDRDTKKDVGSVSLDMQQLILSLGSVYDLELGYNILIKNRFSKNKFSLIPAIVARGDTVFVLTNRIKVSKGLISIDEDKKVQRINKNKEFLVNDFNFEWYKPIKRYVKSVDANLKFEFIIPVIGNIDQIDNKSGLKVMNSMEIGEYISESGEGINESGKKLILKLERSNVFKKSGSLSSSRVKGLVK